MILDLKQTVPVSMLVEVVDVYDYNMLKTLLLYSGWQKTVS